MGIQSDGLSAVFGDLANHFYAKCDVGYKIAVLNVQVQPVKWPHPVNFMGYVQHIRRRDGRDANKAAHAIHRSVFSDWDA